MLQTFKCGLYPEVFHKIHLLSEILTHTDSVGGPSYEVAGYCLKPLFKQYAPAVLEIDELTEHAIDQFCFTKHARAEVERLMEAHQAAERAEAEYSYATECVLERMLASFLESLAYLSYPEDIDDPDEE